MKNKYDDGNNVSRSEIAADVDAGMLSARRAAKIINGTIEDVDDLLVEHGYEPTGL